MTPVYIIDSLCAICVSPNSLSESPGATGAGMIEHWRGKCKWVILQNMERVFYEDVFRALNRHGVRYLIVGGVAVNLLGVPRMTKDLDLMLDLSADNLRLFLSAVKDLGYRPRAPVAVEDFADAGKRASWRREKGAVVFTLNDPRDPLTQVDVFLENPIDFGSAYQARQSLEAGDMTLAVISIEDLIRLKALADRLQDKSDISMLRKVLDERKEG